MRTTFSTIWDINYSAKTLDTCQYLMLIYDPLKNVNNDELPLEVKKHMETFSLPNLQKIYFFTKTFTKRLFVIISKFTSVQTNLIKWTFSLTPLLSTTILPGDWGMRVLTMHYITLIETTYRIKSDLLINLEPRREAIKRKFLFIKYTTRAKQLTIKPLSV